MKKKTVKKKKTSKKGATGKFLKTGEGALIGVVKLRPGSFAFVFKKGNKKPIVGKVRFKTEGSAKKKFTAMVRKKK